MCIIPKFINDIFGNEPQDRKDPEFRIRWAGLVDCEDEQCFWESLGECEARWNEWELQETGRDLPQFFEWFYQKKAKDLVLCYSPEVRRAAGADLNHDGNRLPFPGRVTNNDSEIINLHIQKNQGFRKLPVHKLITALQEFVDRKFSERMGAMFSLDQDTLRVKECYVANYRMSREEFHKNRDPAVRAMHVTKLFPNSVLPPELRDGDSGHTSGTPKKGLSVPVHQAGLGFFPRNDINTSFNKAGELVSSGDISVYPGSGKIGIIDGQWPIIVLPKEGLYECTSKYCAEYQRKFRKIFCQHTLAAAEFQNSLRDYLDLIRKYIERLPTGEVAQLKLNPTAGKKKDLGGRRPNRAPVLGLVPVAGTATNVSCCKGLCYVPTAQEKTWLQKKTTLVKTDFYHNEEPFHLSFIAEEIKKHPGKVQYHPARCISCGVPFNQGDQLAPPEDLCIMHKEQWRWAEARDPVTNEVTLWGYPRPGRKTDQWIHARYQCIKQRYRYFSNHWLEIDTGVQDKLEEQHFNHLREMFGIEIEMSYTGP